MTECGLHLSVADDLILPKDRRACRPQDVHVDQVGYQRVQEATREGMHHCFVSDCRAPGVVGTVRRGANQPKAFLHTGRESAPYTQGRIEAIAGPIRRAVIDYFQQHLTDAEYRDWFLDNSCVDAVKDILIPPTNWSLEESGADLCKLLGRGKDAFDKTHPLHDRNIFILRVLERVNAEVNEWLRSEPILNSVFTSVDVEFGDIGDSTNTVSVTACFNSRLEELSASDFVLKK